MGISRQIQEWRRDRYIPFGKRYIRWLVGICVLVGFVWSDSVFPSFYRSGLAAIEFAVVGLLMRVASGFGRATHDEVHKKNGVLRAVSLAASGLFLLAVGFALLSISLKPGFPMYLLGRTRGRGACILFLCSAIYGYFAQRNSARAAGKQK